MLITLAVMVSVSTFIGWTLHVVLLSYKYFEDRTAELATRNNRPPVDVEVRDKGTNQGNHGTRAHTMRSSWQGGSDTRPKGLIGGQIGLKDRNRKRKRRQTCETVMKTK